jgi:peptidoglycan/LPS O-acetylase OafA/YrhL
MENWLFVFKPLEKTNLLIHFWSLAVEEQFYLVWPFVILFVRKPKNLLLLLSIFLLLLVVFRIVIWQHHVERLQYFSLYTFTRVDGICIGCILALLVKIDRNLPRKYTGRIVFLFAIANFVFFFLNKAHSFTFPFFPFVGYTTIAVVFAVLVYEVMEGKIIILNKIFSNRVLRYYGKISFGFYVFHWPIYVVLNPKIKELFSLGFTSVSNMPMLISSLICTAIGFVVSVLSYHFFEIKFLKLKAHFN